MLRRVLKQKQADRVLWLALAALTLIGVVVAVVLAYNSEAKRTGSSHGLSDSEFEENPLVSVTPGTADSSKRSNPAAESAVVQRPAMRDSAKTAPTTTPSPKPVQPAARPPAPPRVVALLTTPANPTVAAMTPACKGVIDSRGPWLDPRTARPWPECVGADGHVMVVQFCTYAELSNEEWVLSENSRTVPRCQAELPLVREGKVRGAASR